MQYSFFDDGSNNLTDKYSHKCTAPQYNPSSVEPSIAELYSSEKYKILLQSINNSNVPDDVKAFLRLAATRHIVFNYAKIADYYAHADSITQELMEQSALVIIDVNDAISNGYVKLSKTVRDIMEADKDAK